MTAAPAAPAAPAAAALVVDEVTKVYRNGNTANSGISFSVAQGEVFGLLGPNGAGKSTLIRQIAGISTPTSGTIRLLGQPVRGASHVRTVGYMPQSSFALNSLTVGEALYFTCHLSGASRRDALRLVDQVVDDLSLGPLRRRHAAQLSGGQRRLLQLAVALVARKPMVLLDEPTNELDPLVRRQVWRLLRETALDRGTTILFITHNALEAERVVDRVGIVVGSVLERATFVSADGVSVSGNSWSTELGEIVLGATPDGTLVRAKELEAAEQDRHVATHDVEQARAALGSRSVAARIPRCASAAR